MPVWPAWACDPDRTESQEVLQRLENRQVAGRHGDREHESQTGVAGREVGLLASDAEMAFTGHDAAECRTRQSKCFNKHVDACGADADRTRYLVHAMDALYQLSYSPRGKNHLITGSSRLEPVARAAHVGQRRNGV